MREIVGRRTIEVVNDGVGGDDDDGGGDYGGGGDVLMLVGL